MPAVSGACPDRDPQGIYLGGNSMAMSARSDHPSARPGHRDELHQLLASIIESCAVRR